MSKKYDPAVEAKDAKAIAEWMARKAAKRAALPTPAERQQAAIVGLRKYARRLDGKTAALVSRCADEAEVFLREHARLSAELEKPRVNPLSVAVAKAAKELRQVLPACFPTDADALAFASKLDLADARAGCAGVENAAHAADKKRRALFDNYKKAIVKGAIAATGKLSENESVKLIETAGLS